MAGRERIRALTAGKRYQDIKISGKAQLGDTFHFGSDDLLSHLPFAEDAPFNSYNKQHEPTCLENTRADLLNEIFAWAEGSDERCIFWLSGLAGTGKSTVARTVARNYFDKGNLGASFFFSRGGGDIGDAGKFVTTIALQLASNVPPIQQQIRNILAGRSEIASQALRDQWQQLILRPLSALDGSEGKSMYVLVVDALDECDDDRNIRIITQLLAEAQSLTTVRLRVLLTSRPEIPIRRGFSRMSSSQYKDFVLHHISSPTIDHDLAVYFEHSLQIIQQEYALDDCWPGQESINCLVQGSGGLFIWAATVCRFIYEGEEFAERRLSIILRSGTSVTAPERALNKIYTTVLQNAISHTYDDYEIKKALTRLRKVLGHIILLLSPLSVDSLSKLLGFSNQQIDQTLNRLHAILDIPIDSTHPLRLYHPSFRDFLLDKERSSDSNIWVDEEETHQSLAISCIKLMSASLRQDICELGSPGFPISHLESTRVEQYLPTEIQYACLYWIQHLQKGVAQLHDNDRVHQFLLEHFLHWLEAMSCMRKTSEAVRLISSLESLALHCPCPDLQTFTHDMKRFVLYCRPGIEEAPLQVYCSALIFAPTRSEVKRQFKDLVPRWIRRVSEVENDWSVLLRTLRDNPSGTNGVMFSPNGSLLATYVRSEIYLYNPGIGACLHALVGHGDAVAAIAFSGDSNLLASASSDRTVIIWNTSTGKARHTLHGHSSYVHAVSFSPDSRLLASAPWDDTVKVWATGSGIGLYTIRCNHKYPDVVTFSPNGKLIALPFNKTAVMLWDIGTKAAFSTLYGHSASIKCIAFSPDSNLVVSGSEDRTVRLWDTHTGAWLFTFDDILSELRTVIFSPNGKLLASKSDNGRLKLYDVCLKRTLLTSPSRSLRGVTFSPDSKLLAFSHHSDIKLWNTNTRIPLQVLHGHGYSHGLAFSPDGELLASAGSMVQLWDTGLATRSPSAKGHSERITTIAFSLDMNLLASGSSDSAIKLFELSARTVLYTLEGHSDSVTALAFSPNDTILSSASKDNTVALWNCNTGEVLHQLYGSYGHTNSLTFSPDGRLLAFVQGYEDIKVWDNSNSTNLHILKGHLYHVTAIVFSPNSKVLASASYDNTVILWDASTGNMIHKLPDQLAPIHSIAFSEDSKLITSVLGESIVKTWDSATGALFNTREDDSKSMTRSVLSPNGKLVASILIGLTVKVWDPITGETIQMLENSSMDDPSWPSKIIFSQDCKLLAVVIGAQKIKLWKLGCEATPYTLQDNSDYFEVVTFSPDSKLLASGSQSGTLKLWDASTGVLLDTVQGNVHREMNRSESRWSRVAFSPNGKLLALFSSRRTSGIPRQPEPLIKLFDAKTLSVIHELNRSGSDLTNVAFSPNSGLLAAGGYRGSLELWDTATGALLRTLKGHEDSIWVMNFSQRGDMLVSISRDESDTEIGDATAAVWDCASGVALHIFENCNTGPVDAIQFSPNGKLVTFGTPKGIVICKSNTGGVLQQLRGMRGHIYTLDFAPDGRRVASGNHWGLVEIWDLDTSSSVRLLDGHRASITALTFSPDGALLVSAAEDNAVIIWQVDNGAVLQVLQIGVTIHKLRFSSDEDFLETERGQLQPSALVRGSVSHGSNSSNKMFVKSDWITWNMENMLWLPSNYRSKDFTVYKSTIAISYEPYRIFILELAGEVIGREPYSYLEGKSHQRLKQ